MKKSFLFGFAILTAIAAANAKTISPEEALNRVHATQHKVAAKGAVNTNRCELVFTSTTESGVPAAYIFNRPDDAGYLVLSADDLAYPVLGYADEGEFPTEGLPPQLQWWLSEYARQIEYANSSTAISSNSSLRQGLLSSSGRTDREAIAPLLKTDWDQIAPYNNQCPLSGYTRTYTGCVATAMAQVMKYWEYPEKGTGTITYTAETLGKKLSLNLEKTAFDWENMLDSYTGSYTETEANAVAYLMKACGYAVKMDYGTDSSGALAMNISNALTKYFNYDPNILYSLRDYHSPTEWESMIYDNLKNVGPILYGGASMIGGGHSFVCDGYDGNGYFHFNWGWTGMSNGYFLLDALNPEALGSGGGSGGGYNFTQDAVFGIQPPTGKPVEVRPLALTQMGSLEGTIASDSLKFDIVGQTQAMWVNYNPETMKVKFGAIFAPQGSTPGDTIYCEISDKRFSIAAGYGTAPYYFDPGVYLPTAGLSNGTYKVIAATCPVYDNDADIPEGGPEWVEVRECYGYSNYFILKKNGSSYSVENEPIASLTVKGEILSELYYGCAIRVKAVIENPTDIDLSGGFAPIFANETSLLFLGESIYVTVPAHSSIERTWDTNIYQLAQISNTSQDMDLLFTFFDESTYNTFEDVFLEKVVMKANNTNPSVNVTTPVVTGAKRRLVKQENGTYISVNEISDASNIEITSTATLASGYFAYPLYACICSPADNGQVGIETYGGYTVFLSESENTVKFKTTIAYPQCIPGEMYYLIMAYQTGSGLVPMGEFGYMKLLTSGIDTINENEAIAISYDKSTSIVKVSSEETIVDVTATNICGINVGKIVHADANSAEISLADTAQGVIIVTARDNIGNTRTIKIIR